MLSRWPIMAHAAHHLAPAVSYGKRGLLEARIALPSGRSFTVYVTHLDHRSEAHPRGAVGRRPTPGCCVIVAGPTWCWVTSMRWRDSTTRRRTNALGSTAFQQERGWPVPAFDLVGRVLKAGYVDAFASAGGVAGAGLDLACRHAPERRIDYIFLPASWASALRAVRAAARPGWPRPASDHLPVLAELDVEN